MKKRVSTKAAPESKGTALVKRPVGLPKKASAAIGALASVDVQALLAQAIDKNVPIESMERLLAMRQKMKEEWARDRFFAAMAAFQSDCPIVEKKQTAKIRSRKGGDSSFSYQYAPIEDMADAVRSLFDKHGLSWTVKPVQTKDTVGAAVHVHHRDGHEEVTLFTVPIDPESSMSDPQKAGAALTYATRYAFKAAFGIQSRGEDNEASERSRPDIRSENAAQRNGVIPVQAEPVSDDAMKATYDEICAILQVLPEGRARTNLQDAADRNIDSKNGGALAALLESVKRQYPAKETA